MCVSISACVCVCVCGWFVCVKMFVCIHVFMCDREYIREYKTESVPSVCEREGVSVCACECV